MRAWHLHADICAATIDPKLLRDGCRSGSLPLAPTITAKVDSSRSTALEPVRGAPSSGAFKLFANRHRSNQCVFAGWLAAESRARRRRTQKPAARLSEPLLTRTGFSDHWFLERWLLRQRGVDAQEAIQRWAHRGDFARRAGVIVLYDYYRKARPPRADGSIVFGPGRGAQQTWPGESGEQAVPLGLLPRRCAAAETQRLEVTSAEQLRRVYTLGSWARARGIALSTPTRLPVSGRILSSTLFGDILRAEGGSQPTLDDHAEAAACAAARRTGLSVRAGKNRSVTVFLIALSGPGSADERYFGRARLPASAAAEQRWRQTRPRSVT